MAATRSAFKVTDISPAAQWRLPCVNLLIVTVLVTGKWVNFNPLCKPARVADWSAHSAAVGRVEEGTVGMSSLSGISKRTPSRRGLLSG